MKLPETIDALNQLRQAAADTNAAENFDDDSIATRWDIATELARDALINNAQRAALLEAAIEYVEKFCEMNGEPTNGNARMILGAMKICANAGVRRDLDVPRFAIVVDGGLVTGVVADDPTMIGIPFMIVDYDIEGAQHVTTVPYIDGESGKAALDIQRIEESQIDKLENHLQWATE